MDQVNGTDNTQLAQPLGLSWWLFRIVFEVKAKNNQRVVFCVAMHMASAIETALRSIDEKVSDADVVACDRSAPVNCIASSVFYDMQQRRAVDDARAS